MGNVSRVFTVPVSASAATRLKTLVPHVKIKNITIVAVLAAAFLSGCAPLDTNPTPPPKPLPTETVTAQVVQMCIDLSTAVRYTNKTCQDEIDGFTWVYLVDDGHWPAYIPAVGQKLQNGRFRTQRPFGVDIVLAPDGGAYFPR